MAQGEGSVHVWMVISNGGRTNLVILERTSMLSPTGVSWRRKCFHTQGDASVETLYSNMILVLHTELDACNIKGKEDEWITTHQR